MVIRTHTPPAISVSGLRTSYGDRDVVRDVSFDVAAGECFGLLGHNGAGKTPTIEILEGSLTRDAGSVAVLGTDPGDSSSEWRSRVGIVLQDMDVCPTLTVAETVHMFADLYPDSRGVDDPARRASWTMIEALKQLGVTIVSTTHHMDEAQTLADRLVILDDGVVAAEGTFGELLERHGAATLISFRLPADTDIEHRVVAIAGVFGAEMHVDGRHAALSSGHPQRDLRRLLGWADDQRIALDDLTVQRSSLEDLFLSIGGSDDDTHPATEQQAAPR